MSNAQPTTECLLKSFHGNSIDEEFFFPIIYIRGFFLLLCDNGKNPVREFGNASTNPG